MSPVVHTRVGKNKRGCDSIQQIDKYIFSDSIEYVDMMPTKYPTNPFESMFTQIESIIDSGETRFPFANAYDFKIDVVDEEDAVIVTADVPEFDENDLELSIGNDGQMLYISGQHTVDASDSDSQDEETYIWQERQHTTVEQAIPLPVQISEEKTTANYTDGVLTITLPKTFKTPTNGRINISWKAQDEN